MSSEVINHKNVKKGYIYVKLALNLGTFVGQYKFWSKKWIQIECSSDEDQDNIDILIFRNSKSEICIYKKSLQSNNTAIFRSRSRTKSYSFTICDNNEPIIHLSADSETESQEWMRYLRNSLWPPNPLMEFENSINGHFYGSIIDNESSHRRGLLGAYGYLQLSNTNLVLTHPQTGHVIQEWLLSQNTLKNPFENVLQIVKNISSFSGIQNIYMFCKDSEKLLEKQNQINQTKRLNDQTNQTNRVNGPNELEMPSLNGCTSSSIIKKPFDRNIQISDPIKAKHIDCKTFRIRSQMEIPESMLNCSLSSNCFYTNYDQFNENIYSEPSDPFDYIDSDIYEDIDRIYEEIVTKDEMTNGYQLLTDYSSADSQLCSKPINIRQKYTNSFGNNAEENPIYGFDMFSKIVKQTNISLIESKLSIKRSKLLENVSKHKSDNHYCEMKPINGRQLTDGSEHTSDDSHYVYMKSVSI